MSIKVGKVGVEMKLAGEKQETFLNRQTQTNQMVYRSKRRPESTISNDDDGDDIIKGKLD